MPARCLICGKPHAACGGGQDPGTVVDIPAERNKHMAGPLKPYTVMVNGTKTTLLLSEADAQRRGLGTPDDPKKAAAAAKAAAAKAAAAAKKAAEAEAKKAAEDEQSTAAAGDGT